MKDNGAWRSAVFSLVALSLLFHTMVMVRVFNSTPERVAPPDTPTYEQPALSLLETGRFRTGPGRADPEIIRTPGYPLFLAMIYGICGPRREAVIATQIILLLAGLLILYGSCRSASRGLAGFVALSLGVTDLIYSISSHLILAEGLFTFQLVVLLAAYMAMLQAEVDGVRIAWATCCGLLIAAAAMTRPIAYYLPLVFAVSLVAGSRALGITRRNSLRCAGAVLLPCVLILGGWRARNWVVSGSSEFSHIKNINILLYRAAGIIAVKEGVALEKAREILAAEVNAAYPDAPPAVLFEAYGTKGRAVIADNPAIFLRGAAVGFVKMMPIPGENIFLHLIGIEQSTGPAGDLARLHPADFLQRWVLERPFQFALFLFVFFHLGLVYAGALGSLTAIRSAEPCTRRLLLFCWLMILYFIALSSGPEANARFRVPIAPFLFILAGLSFSLWIPRLAQSFRRNHAFRL